jgi:hypothetical protein
LTNIASLFLRAPRGKELEIEHKFYLDSFIKLHKEISLKIDELEQKKKELGLSIMQRMVSPVLQVPGYRVKRFNRLSISVSVDIARMLNAVKMEEVVDKDKIKEIYRNGQPVQGVTEVNYIQISQIP